jgi:vancomycin permeability regulator SanA
MLKKLRQYKWLRRLIYFLLAWVLIHAIFITIDGLKADPAKADVAIVLGNRVFSDGTLASWTKGRVDKALELYKQGKVKAIFVSGGMGVEDHYPEGKAMKAYLVSNGVPDSVVTEDNEGANTYLTAVNFLKWNKEKNYSSAVIVSQFYHITRSKYILKKMGFTGSIFSASSEAYKWRDITGTIREVPAFYKYLLFY